MSYILFGDRGSGSATVELALAEIGAAVELRDVPLKRNAQLDASYAAVNAQRKLPTLKTPAGETLTESAAILLTLAERHPDAALLPPPRTPERAQALRWLIFIAAEIYPVIEIQDYPSRFQPEGETTPPERREALSEHARSLWKQRWLIVESTAAASPWFLAGGFSIVDIYAAVISRWAQVTDWRRVHLPRIETIAAAVAARPACSPVWRRHFG